MIFYFSATGNSKYTAERIAEEFQDTAVSMEGAKHKVCLKENEMLGIVTPVHWWELPVLTRSFLQNLQIEGGRGRYVFMVTTFGTTPGCTYSDAKRVLANNGIALLAGFSVKMPDTWTPVFDLSDTKKVEQQLLGAQGDIEAVLKHIQKRSTGNHMRRKLPYAVRTFTDPGFQKARRTKSFFAEESCIGCGLCAKQCPAHAIVVREGRPVWVKEQCMLCLRCLHYCPVFAIGYGSGKTREHGQYHNPNTDIRK